jgi:hypothetical protein
MPGATVSGNRIIGGKSGIFINNSNKIVIDSNILLDFAELLQNSSAGIILDHSYNCTISNNYLYNITGGNNGKAPSQSQGETGGTGSGIILYNSFNNSLTGNILYNITGGLAESGGTKGNGGLGGLATGFYLINSSYNNFTWNKVINITGGIGGKGGNNADGGIGGYGAGILIENSSFNTFEFIQIANVTGGEGGLAVVNGVDGPGGNASAFYIINSSENIIASFINDIYGGEGLLNGSIEYIYSDGGFNNSWAYQTIHQVSSSQNQTVYFGIDYCSSNDTLLLCYHNQSEPWKYVDVTNTENYTFSDEILTYGEWEWYFWFNDTSNHVRETSILQFSVTSQVTVDAVSTNSGDSNTFTHSHNVSGTDRLLIVSVQTDSGIRVGSITFAGQSLSLIANISHDNGSPNVEVWGLINPPLGINDVIISLSGGNTDNTSIGVISYIGVNQTEPIDAINTAQGYSTTPTITVTSSIGDLVQDVIASIAAGTPTIDSGQSPRWNIEMGGTGASNHYDNK